MLRPSYSELMALLNDDMDLDNKISSRYTIVIAAAKRARQIIDGSPYDPVVSKTDKAVSIAVNEMSRGDIFITPRSVDDNDYKFDDDRYSGDMGIGQGVFMADDYGVGFDESVYEKEQDDAGVDDFGADMDLALDDDIVFDDFEEIDELSDETADETTDETTDEGAA